MDPYSNNLAYDSHTNLQFDEVTHTDIVKHKDSLYILLCKGGMEEVVNHNIQKNKNY